MGTPIEPISFDNLTVGTLYLDNGDYRLPQSVPTAGDMLMYNGNPELSFSSPSVLGFVKSDATATTNGELAVYSSNSNTHINTSHVYVSDLVTNLATNDLNMNNKKLYNCSINTGSNSITFPFTKPTSNKLLRFRGANSVLNIGGTNIYSAQINI